MVWTEGAAKGACGLGGLPAICPVTSKRVFDSPSAWHEFLLQAGSLARRVLMPPTVRTIPHIAIASIPLIEIGPGESLGDEATSRLRVNPVAPLALRRAVPPVCSARGLRGNSLGVIEVRSRMETVGC